MVMKLSQKKKERRIQTPVPQRKEKDTKKDKKNKGLQIPHDDNVLPPTEKNTIEESINAIVNLEDKIIKNIQETPMVRLEIHSNHRTPENEKTSTFDEIVEWSTSLKNEKVLDGGVSKKNEYSSTADFGNCTNNIFIEFGNDYMDIENFKNDSVEMIDLTNEYMDVENFTNNISAVNIHDGSRNSSNSIDKSMEATNKKNVKKIQLVLGNRKIETDRDAVMRHAETWYDLFVREGGLDDVFSKRFGNVGYPDLKTKSIILESPIKEGSRKIDFLSEDYLENKQIDRKFKAPTQKPIQTAGTSRSFSCQYEGCKKVYTSSYGLRYHIEHGHKKESSSEPRPYTCTIENCGKTYKNNNGLKYHISHVHKKTV